MTEDDLLEFMRQRVERRRRPQQQELFGGEPAPIEHARRAPPLDVIEVVKARSKASHLSISDSVSVGEARERIFDGFEERKDKYRVNCPCCGRLVRRYKRDIHAMLARGLIEMLRMGAAKAWVHISEVNASLKAQGLFPKVVNPMSDIGLLETWGLAIRKPNESTNGDSAKKTLGVWRLTREGVAFARNELAVARFDLEYANTVIGWVDEETTIAQQLGERFDYGELMAR